MEDQALDFFNNMLKTKTTNNQFLNTQSPRKTIAFAYSCQVFRQFDQRVLSFSVLSRAMKTLSNSLIAQHTEHQKYMKNSRSLDFN